MIGDGVMVYGDLFKKLLEEMVIFAPAMLHELSAASLGLLAGEKLLAGDELDVAEAVPLYIRSSDAELNLVQKKIGLPE
jgi:tRNA A37 threonylcarbamoyladenosine modification protein TsaB